MLLNRSATAQRLGIVGLYLFAISSGLGQAAFYGGIAFMLFGMLLIPDEVWRGLRREPAFGVALVLTLYIGLRAVAAVSSWPDESGSRIVRDSLDLVAIGGLFSLIVAWWLDGNSPRIALVLQLAMLGLLLRLLTGIEWSDFFAYMSDRPLFGMGNGSGLYALVAIVGLSTLRSSELFEDGWARRKLSSAQRNLIVALLLLAFAIVFLLSQTRAVWLAALIVTPLVLVAMLRSPKRNPQKKWLKKFEVLLVIVIGFGVVLGGDVIKERMNAEKDALKLVFAGDLNDLPADSVGLRISLWDHAQERVRERPLLGWGAGSARQLVRESETPHSLSHYHNLYLQLATEIGLVGLMLFALWLLVLVRSAVRAFRAGHIDFRYLLFVLTVFTIFLITSFFQIRHDDEKGQLLLLLFGAMALTHGLRSTSRSLSGDIRENG